MNRIVLPSFASTSVKNDPYGGRRMSWVKKQVEKHVLIGKASDYPIKIEETLL